MLLFLGNVLLLSCNNCIIKFCTGATEITAVQILLFRAIGMVVGGLIYAKKTNVPLRGGVPADLRIALFKRCVYGYIFNALNFAAIYLMPLSTAVVLSQS